MNMFAGTISLSILAGLALGLFYFGGLWLTVRVIPRARRPWVLVLGSFAARLALTVAAFYIVMAGDWKRLVACLCGFLATRLALTRALGPAVKAPRPLGEQGK